MRIQRDSPWHATSRLYLTLIHSHRDHTLAASPPLIHSHRHRTPAASLLIAYVIAVIAPTPLQQTFLIPSHRHRTFAASPRLAFVMGFETSKVISFPALAISSHNGREGREGAPYTG